MGLCAVLLSGCASSSQPIEDLVSGTLFPATIAPNATNQSTGVATPPPDATAPQTSGPLRLSDPVAEGSVETPEVKLQDQDVPLEKLDSRLMSLSERQKAEKELKALAHDGRKPVTSSTRRIDQLRELGKKHGSDALTEIENTPLDP